MGQLEQLENRRGQATIVAPHDGIVLHPVVAIPGGGTSTVRGPLRRPGDELRKWEPVVMLAGRLRSRVQATLSGADGTRVRVGQPVTVRVADEGAGSVEFQ